MSDMPTEDELNQMAADAMFAAMEVTDEDANDQEWRNSFDRAKITAVNVSLSAIQHEVDMDYETFTTFYPVGSQGGGNTDPELP